jgi:hypothetical protein
MGGRKCMAKRKRLNNEQVLLIKGKQIDMMASMNRATREISNIEDRSELLCIIRDINNMITKFTDLYEKTIKV